jgi:hypothetical protein
MDKVQEPSNSDGNKFLRSVKSLYVPCILGEFFKLNGFTTQKSALLIQPREPQIQQRNYQLLDSIIPLEFRPLLENLKRGTIGDTHDNPVQRSICVKQVKSKAILVRDR